MELIIKIFIYSWIITLFFGIIISISFPLFKEHYDGSLEGLIPIYNLFGLCSFNGYDEKMGLLFLIPFINVFLMMLMGYKLKDKLGLSFIYGIALLLFPVVFIPIIAYIPTHKDEKNTEKIEKFDVEENVENTEIKIQAVDIKANTSKDEELEEENTNEDDSLFRLQSKTQTSTNNKPYKAKRVRVNEQFINSAPAEREKINKVEKENN